MSKFTLFHTCCNWYKLSADDAAVVKRRPSSLSPPPTSAWVMACGMNWGGHVWMLIHTVPHSLQLVQVVCR